MYCVHACLSHTTWFCGLLEHSILSVYILCALFDKSLLLSGPSCHCKTYYHTPTTLGN